MLTTSISGSCLGAIWTENYFFQIQPCGCKTLNMWWEKVMPFTKKCRMSSHLGTFNMKQQKLRNRKDKMLFRQSWVEQRITMITAQPIITHVKHHNFISHANHLPFLLLKFNIKNEKQLQPSATWKKMAIATFQVCIGALQVNEFSTFLQMLHYKSLFQEIKGCCLLKF